MLKLRKVAVTGGISSGKSLFCACLKELGAFVVSADTIVHQLLSPHNTLGKKVIELLGSEILKDGKICRKRIAHKVFNDPQLLRALEQIIHPEIFFVIDKEYSVAQKQNFKLFVAEIPLLFEVGAEKFFDDTIVVMADESLCINRFTKATGKSSNEYMQRMARQLAPRDKALRASYIVLNDGSERDLKNKAKKLFEKLMVIL